MKAVIVMVLCGVALTMARPQDRELNQYQVGGVSVVDGPVSDELNQYQVGGVNVVDGLVSDVNVVDGPGQAPSDVNVVNGPGGFVPDQYFNQHPRPYPSWGSNNNGGYPNVIVPDQFFYQPPRPLYPGSQVGGHPGARSARQVGSNNGWQPAYNQERNPNISIEPEYVDFGNNYPVNPNYPGHLRPGQSPPGARSG